jgi:DNA invertase Pin-like site-specific DNA recombinase
MKRCFGYIRVSTLRQGDGASLDAQRTAIESYAARNGLLVTRWFEEKETAARTGRPVFTALVRALYRREADGVIVHKIDRSARNFADWAKIGDLSDAGIDVHFASETLDFRSRGGRLAADIQAVVAADYIRNLREETLKGLRGRLRQGIWPWPAPPGYLNTGSGKPKAIDPVLGPFVRNLFELYASGDYSLQSLADEIRRHPPLPYGAERLIKRSVLATILANPFYCGVLLVDKTGETFPGKHTRLISVRLFKAVQSVRAGRTAKRVHHHHDFLFSGLFRCANCRTAMVAERQKGHIYYRCHTRECSTKGVREEALSAAIAQTLKATSLPPSNVDEVCKFLLVLFAEDASRNPVQSLRLRLEHSRARLSRLTDIYLAGEVDLETFTTRKQALLMDISELEHRVRDEQSTTISPAGVRQLLELFSSLAQSYETANLAQRRQIVRLATSNRTVMNKNVDVTPSDWLTVGPSGDPFPTLLPASGHNSNVQNAYRDRVEAALRSPEAQELLRILQELNTPKTLNDNRPTRDARGRFTGAG